MDDYSPFVPNVHFEKIPIKNLVSNQDYQRNLSQARIEKTAENFDLFQINPVTGSIPLKFLHLLPALVKPRYGA